MVSRVALCRRGTARLVVEVGHVRGVDDLEFRLPPLRDRLLAEAAIVVDRQGQATWREGLETGNLDQRGKARRAILAPFDACEIDGVVEPADRPAKLSRVPVRGEDRRC